MQRIEKLALEAPLELRMVEVARMKIEIVSVYGDGFIFELDDDFDAFALGAGGKVKKGVFVKAKLGEDAFEAVQSIGHGNIVQIYDVAMPDRSYQTRQAFSGTMG